MNAAIAQTIRDAPTATAGLMAADFNDQSYKITLTTLSGEMALAIRKNNPTASAGDISAAVVAIEGQVEDSRIKPAKDDIAGNLTHTLIINDIKLGEHDITVPPVLQAKAGRKL